ncbi:methyltransferase-related [Schistosoma mansoni]|uniref:Methyltransferase-related n=1 Tax=Schistosoma mansoni TaxID=6183 RepID=G4VKK8_SCHMA|nr:methyltransferase-related [Schistosoma mansoni]|eukprot:XP_018652817.1 methyltransferase-related [Schistosoma mansoni]
MASKDYNDIFGCRYLTEASDVYELSAWDDFQWTEEQENLEKEMILLNSTAKLPDDSQERIEILAHEYWDKFYSHHEDRFIKDRNWLEKEFYELFSSISPSVHIMEVGCGVGNTIFPILRAIKSPGLLIYVSDFSEKALSILKESKGYYADRCITLQHDITKTNDEIPCRKNSLDFLVLVFVLSAVNPELFHRTLKNLVTYIKPGGVLLF